MAARWRPWRSGCRSADQVEARGIRQGVAHAVLLLPLELPRQLVHAALDVQGHGFELHAVFIHAGERSVEAQREQGEQQVADAQADEAARAQVAFEASHMAYADLVPGDLEQACLAVGACRCGDQQRQEAEQDETHDEEQGQPKPHVLHLAGEQRQRAAEGDAQNGAHHHHGEQENGQGGQPHLHEIHVHRLPAAGLGAQARMEHQHAAVVVFEPDGAQHGEHERQREQCPHGAGDLREPAAAGTRHGLGRQCLQPVERGQPDGGDGEHGPARRIDLPPAGGELQAQPAPARVAEAEAHGAAPDERGERRAREDEEAHRGVLPGAHGDLVGGGEHQQHDESEDHAALLRGEFERAAGHERVAVEVLHGAAARPGGVEAQRQDAQQHVDDPDAEILAAAAGELQRMRLDAVRRER